MRRVVMASMFALVLPSAALASVDSCQEPFGPVLPKAETVTEAQLATIKEEVVTFIKDSDAYQSCLVAAMNTADRSKDDKMTDGEKAAVNRRIASNQREKETIGNGYNELVRVVNARSGKK